MASLNFDATSVEPAKAFEPLAPGKYTVQITSSEMRPTKNGAGQYLYLEMEVLDGADKGRKLFDRLNLENENQQTVEIAQRSLSAICHAVGKMAVKDSEELHYKSMIATVAVQPPKGEYGASNVVKGYAVAEGKATVRPATASQPTATTTSPPWRKAG